MLPKPNFLVIRPSATKLSTPLMPCIADSDTFAAAAKTTTAHKAVLQAAEGISAIGLKVLVDDDFRKRIKKEWEEDMKANPVDEAVESIAKALPVSDKPVQGSVCACLH